MLDSYKNVSVLFRSSWQPKSNCRPTASNKVLGILNVRYKNTWEFATCFESRGERAGFSLASPLVELKSETVPLAKNLSPCRTHVVSQTMNTISKMTEHRLRIACSPCSLDHQPLLHPRSDALGLGSSDPTAPIADCLKGSKSSQTPTSLDMQCSFPHRRCGHLN